MNLLNAEFFTLAAIGLLGSPRPGIAALAAIGARAGFVGSLRFYGGLQLGLAIAALLTAFGLLSVLASAPVLASALRISATLYLIYLAFRIATAPVGAPAQRAAPKFVATAFSGFLLGVINPKAYVAFASLLAFHSILESAAADIALKWGLCVLVMIVVDAIWLAFGAAIGKAHLNAGSQRALNLAFGLAVACTAFSALE
jgi:threonine/homoserine/homoserine lactone efflux protein